MHSLMHVGIWQYSIHSCHATNLDEDSCYEQESTQSYLYNAKEE